MNLTLDSVLVIAAIIVACGFLCRGFIFKKKPGCGGGCGCDTAKKPASRP